jgi:hypothetical protein
LNALPNELICPKANVGFEPTTIRLKRLNLLLVS